MTTPTPTFASLPTTAPGKELVAGVLVGGRGTRLGGCDKARLRRADGKTLVQHIVTSLEQVGLEVVLAGTAEQRFPELRNRMVYDQVGGCGPLAGIAALLTANPAPWCFVVAVDLAAFAPAVLWPLWNARMPHHIVVPKTSRGLEPTCALWPQSARADVEAALAAQAFSLQRLILRVKNVIVTMPPELEQHFVNINRWEDSQAAVVAR